MSIAYILLLVFTSPKHALILHIFIVPSSNPHDTMFPFFIILTVFTMP
ncbi:hypothetical protein HERIO_2753 [Hepatospora eriocheir]|uniref:Uncharacterized protein n=1 Tax=Hepatospora eriocheir TaxID=1081669 RepID=A0A1X0QDD1_9MICR|nr:hypothetical protein HERIO_2753 [Hepatospora eriocheir]